MVEQKKVTRSTALNKNTHSVEHTTGQGKNVIVTTDPHHNKVPIVKTVKGLQHGQLPSNTEITSNLENAKTSLDANTRNQGLNAHGQVLKEDTKNMLSSAQHLLQNKNEGDVLQDILVESAQETRQGLGKASMKSKQMANKENIQYGKEKALEKGRETFYYIRQLALFFVRSSGFRSLLLEVVQTFQMYLTSAQYHTTTSQQTQLQAQEARQKLEYRFRSLLYDISSSNEYRTAINQLFKVSDNIMRQMDNITSKTKAKSKDSHLRNMNRDAKIIVSRFAGEKTSNETFNSIWQLYYDLRNDKEAKYFFSTFRILVNDMLEHPELLNSNQFTQRFSQLMEDGKWISQSESSKYKDRFIQIFDNLRLMFDNIKYDNDRVQFQKSFEQLLSDFAMDESGSPDLFVLQDSLDQMRKILLPLIQKQFESIPLPKLEMHDEKYDFALENMTFSGKNILPNHIKLKVKNSMDFLPNELSTGEMNNEIKLKIKNIQTELQNLKFFYNRKKMPKIHDTGFADVILGGKGFSLEIVWKILKKGPNDSFSLEMVKVKPKIDKLSIKVRESQHHSILNKIGAKLLQGRIKKQIITGVRNSTEKNLSVFQTKINEFFSDRSYRIAMERANEAMKTTYQRQMERPPITQTIKEKATNVGKKAQMKKNELQQKMQHQNQPNLLQQQQQQQVFTSQPIGQQQGFQESSTTNSLQGGNKTEKVVELDRTIYTDEKL